MKTLTALLHIAQKASIEAGQKILEIYNNDFSIDYKADDSPLTLADQRANAVIMEHLNELNIPIISEENKQINYNQRKKWQQFWLVDPLDGTKEFIKKNDEFTVNIALIENGIPVLGVIYIPVKKELFFGTKKNGAFKMQNIHTFYDVLNGKVNKIQPKPHTKYMVVVASRSHLSIETQTFIDKIKNQKSIESVQTISAGSSLKLCMVAEGKADVYPRFAPTMEWDVAAGHAICLAAGVTVINAETQEDLKYNKENLLNPWFIVGKPLGL